jgi:hypothetical protein
VRFERPQSAEHLLEVEGAAEIVTIRVAQRGPRFKMSTWIDDVPSVVDSRTAGLADQADKVVAPDARRTRRIVDEVAVLVLNRHSRDLLLPAVVALGREPQRSQAAPVRTATTRMLLEQLGSPANSGSNTILCLFAENRDGFFAEIGVPFPPHSDVHRSRFSERSECGVALVGGLACTSRQSQTSHGSGRPLLTETASITGA